MFGDTPSQNRYRFEKVCPDLPGVNDGTHTIFVNASGLLNEQGEDYANLMAYLRAPLPIDRLTRAIDTAVDVLRDRKDLRREFVTLQEKMDRAKEEGREEGIEETLQKLSAALNLPIEQLQALLEETR